MILLALTVFANPSDASADVFGRCAHERDGKEDRRLHEGSRSTSYPWILHWVYRELARAHRERGEIDEAIASYAQSLAAEEREWVRREMQELAQLKFMARN